MVSIERLIDEHGRITTLGNAVMRGAGTDPAATLRAMIVRLDVQLADHLATEDLELYPHLLAAGDMSQREAAEIAMADFDSLAGQWRTYVADWTEAEIDADRDLFVEASKRVLSALAARVRIENEILYPLALRCGTIALREANVRVSAN
ncbi:hemerythrin domain-containing protein [Sphingomonas suaedae]|uniref:Hemerythrin domain-containing protein n=1 Tax=Sphingomonas suaedae TaxID=2599297 RepID=A0A518RJD6_9SPHN|nr:hemerythrin domain-containing protein [Sphingomonas suaedae]QDX27567.1 hemerythrin domain-containing protein [Sphingomonas suaedae]